MQLHGAHYLGASEKAGYVSDFMSNTFHNINSYLAVSGFSEQVCAQVWSRGGGEGKRCRRPRQQSSGGGKTSILNEIDFLPSRNIKFLRQIKGN
jgi:hypothetical protein